MTEGEKTMDFPEKRSEPRKKITDLYYSVEFSVEGLFSYYQFKLRDISQRGLCITVSDDSAVLNYIKVGDIINMRYRSSERSAPATFFQTEIRHITNVTSGPFQGHHFIGLLILEDNPLDIDALD